MMRRANCVLAECVDKCGGVDEDDDNYDNDYNDGLSGVIVQLMM